MCPAQCNQPVCNGFPSLFHGCRVLQTLRGNRHYCRKCVLHAMMQFLKQQALQTRGSFLLRGINSSLCQQLGGVYSGLCQHLAETNIFRLQRILFGGRNIFGHAPPTNFKNSMHDNRRWYVQKAIDGLFIARAREPAPYEPN